MNKTGPGCKYFYTVMDCGLILGKAGVSLAKRVALTVTFPVRPGLGLTRAVRSRSGGLGRKGSAGGGANGGARRRSPEFAVYGVPGVNPARVWV